MDFCTPLACLKEDGIVVVFVGVVLIFIILMVLIVFYCKIFMCLFGL